MIWRDDQKALLESAFMAGVNAAHPDGFFATDDMGRALAQAATTKGRVLVLGAGKAAAAMAAALEREWPGTRPLEGLVVTRAGYEVSTRNVEVAMAGHPYPENQGAGHAARMLSLAAELGKDDLLIGLWSGGGSSLLACPPGGMEFQTFIELTKSLLGSGADIHQINTVRKHLSRISGGRLAKAAAPASLLNLVIPDVVGSDTPARLSAIASGPCVPDPTTLADAARVLDLHGINEFESFLTETPKSWDEIGTAHAQTLELDGNVAVTAAADALRAHGFSIFTEANVTAEARAAAGKFARIALGHGGQRPAAIVSGGELTVTVKGTGTGGPNQEHALALAIALDGAEGIAAVAGDTDGIDGPGEVAGAFVFPDTLKRLRAAGVDPQAALANNDATGAFKAIGDLLVTGPTHTNVDDLRLIVING